jgi:hypothetical protein
MGRLRGGEIDAIFDEGVVLWADQVAAAGAGFLPLSPGRLEALQGQGFRRALIERSRYPTLPADVPAVDFSGWPIYCRADTPDALVERFCQALVSRRDHIVWGIGGPRQPFRIKSRGRSRVTGSSVSAMIVPDEHRSGANR